MRKFSIGAVLTAVCLVAALAFAGCASAPKGDAVTAGSADDPFAGTTWSSAAGAGLYGSIAMNISFADGKASGNVIGKGSRAYSVVKTEAGTYAAVIKGIPFVTNSYSLETDAQDPKKGLLSVTAGFTTSTADMVKQ